MSAPARTVTAAAGVAGLSVALLLVRIAAFQLELGGSIAVAPQASFVQGIGSP